MLELNIEEVDTVEMCPPTQSIEGQRGRGHNLWETRARRQWVVYKFEYVASPLESSQLPWYVVEINFQQLRASEVGSSRDRRWDDKEVPLSSSYFPPRQL